MAKNYLTKGEFVQDDCLDGTDFIGGRNEYAAETFRNALENFGNFISIEGILGISINYQNNKFSFSSEMSQQLSNAFYNQVMKGSFINLGGHFGGFNRWCNKVRSELKSQVVKNQANVKKALGNPKIDRQKIINDVCDRIKKIFNVNESSKLFNNKSNSRLAHNLSKEALKNIGEKIDTLKTQNSDIKTKFLNAGTKKTNLKRRNKISNEGFDDRKFLLQKQTWK